MSKNVLTENILTSVFKTLFRGKVNAIEKALKDDPILKKKTKELHRHLDELTKYVNDNIGDYGT
ncbi:MAG: hypothetical protein H8E98_06225 [Bacteroidetes bacterium]|nr:hypothetical protein [Bacteroidota bacterium]